MERIEKLHNQDKARGRDARKAKKEAVTNVAESMHETPSRGVFPYKQWPVRTTTQGKVWRV